MCSLDDDALKDFDMAPITPQIHRVHRVCVHWELHDIVARNLEDGQSFLQMVTITGGAENAIMTSAAEYMMWAWPATGLQTLQAVDKMVRDADYRSQG